jgi:hypothetical protein
MNKQQDSKRKYYAKWLLIISSIQLVVGVLFFPFPVNVITVIGMCMLIYVGASVIVEKSKLGD